jgi:hypothetical protein
LKKHEVGDGSAVSRAARLLRHRIEPLWVAGLVALCLLLGWLLLSGVGIGGERREQALYLSLGTVFPALLLALSLPGLLTRFSPGFARASRLALAAFFVVGALALLALAWHRYLVLAGAGAQLGLTYALLRLRREPWPAPAATSVLVVVASWAAAATFLWWSDIGGWFSGAWYRGFVFALALLLVVWNLLPGRLRPAGASEGKPRRRRLLALDGIAVLLLGAASINADRLMLAQGTYNHWGVWVGPAELVRQGGWPLWDVPTQYGFLNTLAIAALPFGSVWQSAYVLNGLLLWLTAVLIYLVVRSFRGGLATLGLAFALASGAVFLVWGSPGPGFPYYPSTAAPRYFWCYALLGVLAWEARSGSASPSRRLLLSGCAVWLLGTLWSVESAAYSFAVWLPAFFLLVLRRRSETPRGGNLRAALWLALPPFLLFSSLAAICAFYAARLGHLPDPAAFYDYAARSEVFDVPIAPDGPVWVCLLVFCALSTVAAGFLRRGLAHRALPLVAGTWGALWATSVYFAVRSHPLNVTNALTPIFCLAIGLTVYLLARHREDGPSSALVRASLVPVLTVLLVATFGAGGNLSSYVSTTLGGYEQGLDERIPRFDPSLSRLLVEAGVRPDDPISYAGASVDREKSLRAWPTGDEAELVSSPRAWLPSTPYFLFLPLEEERRQTYMSRFAERTRTGGWLIERTAAQPYTASPWFSEQILRTHRPTRVVENKKWRLTCFEYTAPATDGSASSSDPPPTCPPPP